MRRFAVLLPLILIACGTPQEQCIDTATRDMRVVDRLIAQSEATLARGYAIEEKTIYMPTWVNCARRHGPDTPKPRLCLKDVPQTIRSAVAVDLTAEAAKRDSLKAKRAAQAKAAATAIKACKAQFPE